MKNELRKMSEINIKHERWIEINNIPSLMAIGLSSFYSNAFAQILSWIAMNNGIYAMKSKYEI